MQVEKNQLKLAKRFKAEISAAEDQAFRAMQMKAQDLDFSKEALQLKRRPSTPFFKEPAADGRVYPGYFTWVMVMENGNRVFKKMRYRVRPHNSPEIPSKFNVFNARVDAIEQRKTWKGLFMRRHALVPFVRFYEWVEHQGAKKLISFAPEDKEIMWAPCLWDHWENTQMSISFSSFAIITDDPPPEVSEMGHDRCPIFLQENYIDAWLTPQGKSKSDMYEILKTKEAVIYKNEWAAAS
ncbi:MAG TPA: SOS response-associated peptidase family protein [Bacteriovoracaceae bacterium]|nr:SOS response-associated peptidase family protein [Bacteriovoracaceae bacterium]